MPGRGPKTKGHEGGERGASEPETEEQKLHGPSGEGADLPVEDPDPEAQPDGDPGLEDKKRAGC